MLKSKEYLIEIGKKLLSFSNNLENKEEQKKISLLASKKEDFIILKIFK